MGISLKRDVPKRKVNYKKDYLDFAVYISNNDQSIEIYSTDNLGTQIVNRVLELKSILIKSFKQIDKYKWREKYSNSKNEFINGESYFWDYKDLT